MRRNVYPLLSKEISAILRSVTHLERLGAWNYMPVREDGRQGAQFSAKKCPNGRILTENHGHKDRRYQIPVRSLVGTLSGSVGMTWISRT